MKKNLLIFVAVLSLFFAVQYAYSTTTTDGNSIVSGTLAVTGHTTFEGVTSTGATGTGKLVYDTAPVIGLTAATGPLPNGIYYGLLKSLYVATDESTASTTFVDLTTPDTVTFTLAATTLVSVRFSSECYLATTQGADYNIVNLDGSNQSGNGSGTGFVTAQLGFEGTCVANYSGSLASGAHTIKIQHRVTAGTGHWVTRLLTVAATL